MAIFNSYVSLPEGSKNLIMSQTTCKTWLGCDHPFGAAQLISSQSCSYVSSGFWWSPPILSTKSHLFVVPSGKPTKNYGKSPSLIGKTISMGHFQVRKLLVYQRVYSPIFPISGFEFKVHQGHCRDSIWHPSSGTSPIRVRWFSRTKKSPWLLRLVIFQTMFDFWSGNPIITILGALLMVIV